MVATPPCAHGGPLETGTTWLRAARRMVGVRSFRCRVKGSAKIIVYCGLFPTFYLPGKSGVATSVRPVASASS
jgi:hypothetical protein